MCYSVCLQGFFSKRFFYYVPRWERGFASVVGLSSCVQALFIWCSAKFFPYLSPVYRPIFLWIPLAPVATMNSGNAFAQAVNKYAPAWEKNTGKNLCENRREHKTTALFHPEKSFYETKFPCSLTLFPWVKRRLWGFYLAVERKKVRTWKSAWYGKERDFYAGFY